MQKGVAEVSGHEGDAGIEVVGLDVDIPSISSIGGLRSADDLKTPFR
jgi:hypothetical protein